MTRNKMKKQQPEKKLRTREGFVNESASLNNNKTTANTEWKQNLLKPSQALLIIYLFIDYLIIY